MDEGKDFRATDEAVVDALTCDGQFTMLIFARLENIDNAKYGKCIYCERGSRVC